MSDPACTLNELKRLLGSGDPLPPAYAAFAAQSAEAKKVSDGFARLDALLAEEPIPPEIDVTRRVMSRLAAERRARWTSWVALAASVALVVGLAASLLAPEPLDSLAGFVSDPFTVDTGYARPDLPLGAVVDAPSDWLSGVLDEVRAALPDEALPQTPLALILLLAPAVLGLNWFVSRREQPWGGIA